MKSSRIFFFWSQLDFVAVADGWDNTVKGRDSGDVSDSPGLHVLLESLQRSQRGDTANEHALALQDLVKRCVAQEKLENAMIQQFIKGQAYD